MENGKFKELKKVLGGRIKEAEPLWPYTTFKIGGPADLFFEAQTREEIIQTVRLTQKLEIPYFILGGGSNLLVSDKGFRGLVIRNKSSEIRSLKYQGQLERADVNQTKKLRIKSFFLEADSGVIFNRLVRYTLDNGLEGLEYHLGLPGTIGGAIYLNAKWAHPFSQVSDSVFQAKIINRKGEIRDAEKSYFQFGYDWSILQKTKEVVLSVIFILKGGSKEKLWKKAEEVIEYRRITQPKGFSSGCIFRNTDTYSAGFLIESAGLKGERIGGAMISGEHANFIINLGQAKAKDVIKLINLCKKKVKEKSKVGLEEEIIYLGQF